MVVQQTVITEVNSKEVATAYVVVGNYRNNDLSGQGGGQGRYRVEINRGGGVICGGERRELQNEIANESGGGSANGNTDVRE